MLKGLLQRIEFTWVHLIAATRHMPAIPLAVATMIAFSGLQQSVQQSINTINMQVCTAAHSTLS
jgi:hypothetical protein